MRIDVMSDLHLDLLGGDLIENFFARYREHVQTYGAPDVLAIAGDLCGYGPARGLYIDRFQEIVTPGEVVETPGNHDFWDSGVLPSDMHSMRESNIDSVKWLYGTGWFDADVIPTWLRRGWPDFRFVGSNSHEATSSITIAHRACIAQLERSEADVVVLHHFPVESTHERWFGSNTNVFFSSANFCEALQKAPKLPKLFIHGHTHDPMDYIHPLGFRVYCNPLGYDSERSNINFWNRVRITL